MTRALLIACVAVTACASGARRPVAIRLGEDACAHCRMTIVSIKTAAQIVSPGGEPVMFDELGCLRDHLAGHPLPEGARIFVADHRTGDWLEARAAVFTQAAEQTPMGSGLIAHRDGASRDTDPAARHGTPVTAGSILDPTPRSTTP